MSADVFGALHRKRATCACSKTLVTSGKAAQLCEYECTGVLQYDEATGKVTDCEDYEEDEE